MKSRYGNYSPDWPTDSVVAKYGSMYAAQGKLGGLCQAYNKIFSHFPLTSVFNFIYWCAQFDYWIIINN